MTRDPISGKCTITTVGPQLETRQEVLRFEKLQNEEEAASRNQAQEKEAPLERKPRPPELEKGAEG